MNKKRIVLWGKEIAIVISIAFVLNLVLTALLITTKGIVSHYLIWGVWFILPVLIGCWLGYVRWWGIYEQYKKTTKSS